MSGEELHGGNVYGKRIEIDFSVNINPLGMPGAAEAALHGAVADCGRYPDIANRELKKAVSGMIRVPEEYLLFGNGASELFMACVHGIAPQKMVIPVPSFYGYTYAARAGGGEILFYEMQEETGFTPGEDVPKMLGQDTDLLFLANPGNPAGTLTEKAYLKRMLDHCLQRNIYVVLDECFIEFCGEEYSMIGETERFKNLILVRAFTKIFAVPGVRLGYLVCSDSKIRNRIASQIPEWNISGFAQAAGIVCAAQKDFLRETVDYVAEERRFLAEGLRRNGVRVLSGEANFLLIHDRRDLYGKLLEKGILIRDCRNFRGLSEGFYRIAVKSREENEILLRKIGEIS